MEITGSYIPAEVILKVTCIFLPQKIQGNKQTGTKKFYQFHKLLFRLLKIIEKKVPENQKLLPQTDLFQLRSKTVIF